MPPCEIYISTSIWWEKQPTWKPNPKSPTSLTTSPRNRWCNDTCPWFRVLEWGAVCLITNGFVDLSTLVMCSDQLLTLQKLTVCSIPKIKLSKKPRSSRFLTFLHGKNLHRLLLLHFYDAKPLKWSVTDDASTSTSWKEIKDGCDAINNQLTTFSF